MSRFGRPPAPRRHLAGKIAAVVAAITLTWAFGGAQDAFAQDSALMLGGMANNGREASPRAHDGFSPSGAEPRELSGMLQRQNEARRTAGSSALAWSDDLAAHVRAGMEEATQPVCSQTTGRRLAAEQGFAFHWIAPLRRMDSSAIQRNVSAPYIVSEWNLGRSDYDGAAKSCRRSGACDNYSAMVAPQAKLVGCARVTCGNGAQIIACGYAPGPKPVNQKNGAQKNGSDSTGPVKLPR